VVVALVVVVVIKRRCNYSEACRRVAMRKEATGGLGPCCPVLGFLLPQQLSLPQAARQLLCKKGAPQGTATRTATPPFRKYTPAHPVRLRVSRLQITTQRRLPSIHLTSPSSRNDICSSLNKTYQKHSNPRPPPNPPTSKSPSQHRQDGSY
jgi:hypothetical protein